MAKNIKDYPLRVVIITILLMPTTWAQRPSFAGNRPPNGLNQKDKYHLTTATNNEISNRFGNADAPNITNQIPFGQPQKPPVGYPVVLPESVYTALTSSKPISTSHISTSLQFEDRFGQTDKNTVTTPLSSSTTSTTKRPGVPLDAHGDQLLIDQLNQTPIDKRPFWFINYQAIEAQRNGTTANFGEPQSSRGSFLG